MVHCPNCDSPNREGSRFCSVCGADLMPACSQCGSSLSSGARFCPACGTAVGSAVPLARDARGALVAGEELEGRYKVSCLLGMGGFGAVYEAIDRRLGGRKCALKEVFDPSPDARRQFQREARFLAHLTHPRLVRLTDYFSTPAGELFLVMEYVKGRDLEDVVETAPSFLPEDRVVGWMQEVCEVLEHMHGWVDPETGQPSPVIHRDIKPGNLKLRPDGTVMVIDLGIAKVMEPGRKTTRAAQAVSPPYSPVEQYGQGTDQRSDIYALGVTMYHLLTGKLPPDAPDLTHGEAVPPRQHNPRLSRWLESIVLRAMMPNPLQRFQSVKEMRVALGTGGSAADGSRSQAVLAPAMTLKGIEFVLIPGGEFIFGRKEQRVDLHSYYISRTPVTNTQYKAFVDATRRRKPDHWKYGRFPSGKGDHPVVNVTWGDAVAYCAWLRKRTQQPVRLPSEREWEKGARGTDSRTYPWGSHWDPSRCNTRESRIGGTSPVTRYPHGASPYGLLDMAGNVWEWCEEWRQGVFRGRVLRGGSWWDRAKSARTMHRSDGHPETRYSNRGFRCAMSVP